VPHTLTCTARREARKGQATFAATAHAHAAATRRRIGLEMVTVTPSVIEKLTRLPRTSQWRLEALLEHWVQELNQGHTCTCRCRLIEEVHNAHRGKPGGQAFWTITLICSMTSVSHGQHPQQCGTNEPCTLPAMCTLSPPFNSLRVSASELNWWWAVPQTSRVHSTGAHASNTHPATPVK
jgi:hypothetical protein